MDSAPALGLPEVMLGLVPGWGGAWLVPNLVGADKAVTLIVENPLNQGKTLGGQAAYDFGLADAVFSGADFLEQSLLWAASVLRGEVVVERPEVDRGEAWDAAIARAEGIVAAKTGGGSPAAKKAVELIAAARDTDRDDRLRGRGRRPRGDVADRRAARRRSTPSTSCRSGPSGPPARPTSRSPAR